MSDKKRREIHERFNSDEEVDEAVVKAVRMALADHKRKKNTVAVWKDDKVVLLTPDQIPAPEGSELPNAE